MMGHWEWSTSGLTTPCTSTGRGLPTNGWSGEETLWDVNQGVDPATLVAQDLAVVSSNEDPLLLDVFYIGLDNALHHAFA